MWLIMIAFEFSFILITYAWLHWQYCHWWDYDIKKLISVQIMQFTIKCIETSLHHTNISFSKHCLSVYIDLVGIFYLQLKTIIPRMYWKLENASRNKLVVLIRESLFVYKHNTKNAQIATEQLHVLFRTIRISNSITKWVRPLRNSLHWISSGPLLRMAHTNVTSIETQMTNGTRMRRHSQNYTHQVYHAMGNILMQSKFASDLWFCSYGHGRGSDTKQDVPYLANQTF